MYQYLLYTEAKVFLKLWEMQRHFAPPCLCVLVKLAFRRIQKIYHDVQYYTCPAST